VNELKRTADTWLWDKLSKGVSRKDGSAIMPDNVHGYNGPSNTRQL